MFSCIESIFICIVNVVYIKPWSNDRLKKNEKIKTKTGSLTRDGSLTHTDPSIWDFLRIKNNL